MKSRHRSLIFLNTSHYFCWFHCRYLLHYASDESQQSSFTSAPLHVCLDRTGATLMQNTHQLHCNCLCWPQLSRKSPPAVAADLHSEVLLIGEKWCRVCVGVQTAATFKRWRERPEKQMTEHSIQTSFFYVIAPVCNIWQWQNWFFFNWGKKPKTHHPEVHLDI